VTLCEKISLVDSLIRENPDVTINDYLETVQEIEKISESYVENYHPNVKNWNLNLLLSGTNSRLRPSAKIHL